MGCVAGDWGRVVCLGGVAKRQTPVNPQQPTGPAEFETGLQCVPNVLGFASTLHWPKIQTVCLALFCIYRVGLIDLRFIYSGFFHHRVLYQ